MRILAACEWSGRVRDAFRERGHDAWSCDLEETCGEYRDFHVRDDVLNHLEDSWDMMIGFPPCTYLSNAGQWRYGLDRIKGTESALEFVRTLMNSPIPQICIENPPGQLSSRIRKPDQVIQPYQFGDPYVKTTHLWLKGLPKLQPTTITENPLPWVNGGRSRQTGMHRNPKLRGMTFKGIAEAMASQWG
jgi:site-specific DNA-cytosine methylase